MKKKSINIIGAFDRYNYGDLLFPIVTEKYIQKYKSELLDSYALRYFALVESDLSKVGGKKTDRLEKLYTENMEEGSMIVVSGGDVLPARISSMDIDLSRNRFTTIGKKVARKFMGVRKFEEFSMRKFNLKTRFPWVVDNEYFDKKIHIKYNAVGGSTIDKLPSEDIAFIKSKLKDSDYISVRDNKSLSNVKELGAKLAPDCATVMSEFFPVEYLEKHISKQVKDYVSNEKKYITIQTNLCSVKGKEETLVKEIEKISKETGLKILLLPIGIASNHDDNIALRRLHKYFTADFTHFEDINIYDIMYLIANSKFFAGTSLHGNITSMSYGVAHIGLNKSISKLDNYLKTWDLKEQNHCINFEDLYEEFVIINKISKDKLIEKREEIVNLTLENFHQIFSALEV